MNIKTHRQGKAFTLVEMMVVVAIIGILASILIPVLARSKTKAKVASAKFQMAELIAAVKSYKSDNGRYPMPSFLGEQKPDIGLDGDVTFGDGFGLNNDNSYVVSILINKNHSRNPKKNEYLSLKSNGSDTEVGAAGLSNTNDYLDPFGNPYNITFNKDGDGGCEDAFYMGMSGVEGVGLQATGLLKGSDVMIWTNGPDRERDNSIGVGDEVNADNVLSWN